MNDGSQPGMRIYFQSRSHVYQLCYSNQFSQWNRAMRRFTVFTLLDLAAGICLTVWQPIDSSDQTNPCGNTRGITAIVARNGSQTLAQNQA